MAEQVDRSPSTPDVIQFTTKYAPDEVLEWYKQEMVAQGWKVYIESHRPPPAVISFTSSGYRVLFVLDVFAERTPDGITLVRVELKSELPA
jgi:hypothetical protein